MSEVSIVVKLFLGTEEIELKSFKIDLNRNTNPKGKPIGKATSGNVKLSYDALRNENFMLRWMLDHREDDGALSPNQSSYKLKNAKIVFYNDLYEDRAIYTCELTDCVCVDYHETFDINSGMHTNIILSSAILTYKDLPPFVKSWNESWEEKTEQVYTPLTVVEEIKPSVTKVEWVDKDKQVITETGYNAKVGLKITLANQNGGTVTAKIKKKDGTKFNDAQTEIRKGQTVSGDTVYIENIAIDEKWLDFKKVEIDELIATVEHDSSTKDSGNLELIPPPSVVVDFRPNKAYDGEYGFDYMRDKKEKDDKFTYKDILGTNKTVAGANKFTKYPTDTKYNSLKDNVYKTKTFPWYKDSKGAKIEYIQSWMSIYPGEKQTVSLQLNTIENPKNLDLTLEYDKALFKLSTDTIPAQSVGKKRLDDHIVIECLKGFTTDQSIKVMYEKRQLGQLKVVKNDKTERKKAEVVFIKVKSEIVSGVKNTGNTNNKSGGTEEDMLKRYLKQAYVKLELDEVTFDLTAVDATTKKAVYPNFNKNYTLLDKTGNKILNKYHNTAGSDNLVEYMEKTLNKTMPKYKDHFKVFFFDDTGGRKDKTKGIVKLAGYAKAINSQSAIIFKGKRKATMTHELLHCIGLKHSFSNGTYDFEKKVTENIMDYSSKRTHIWMWQWKTLWNNANIKSE